MPDRLTRARRLDILAELCPKHGSRRACDSHELARERAESILGPSDRAELAADYVLMRAIDQYTAGDLSIEDLYRCRILAYYMTFARGGEEWARWGVAAGIRPGDFPDLPDDSDLEDFPLPLPSGPPWGASST
ncbi:MAG TPA: hypothetical protein VK689_23725 [Armatimonadota bacterium]|nr:hypothetical protein [Armatimonadota bacterium]